VQIVLALETLATKWPPQRSLSKEMAHLGWRTRITDKCINRNETQGVVNLCREYHDILCRSSVSKRIVEFSQLFRVHMLRFRIIGMCVKEYVEEHFLSRGSFQHLPGQELDKTQKEINGT